MTTCGGVLEEYLHFLCSYITKSYGVESNFFAMQCCRAIICLLSFIFQPPAICHFYSALVLQTLHPYSHYYVFTQGYFRLCCYERSQKEKREVAPASYAGRQDTLQRYKGCSVLPTRIWSWSDFSLFFLASLMAAESEIPLHKNTTVRVRWSAELVHCKSSR